MSIHVAVLMLSLFVGCSTRRSPITTKSSNERSVSSANNSSAAVESDVDKRSVDDEGSKTWDCDDPKGYSVEEGTEPGTHPVNIVRDGQVLQTIKLPTGVDVNGFAFDGAKKTKEGFEIAIEYGSRIFYHKRFIFICRNHKFYLSRIGVDSFDRHNPEKWSKKVLTVRPNLLLEKFSVTDFMLEGVVQR